MVKAGWLARLNSHLPAVLEHDAIYSLLLRASCKQFYHFFYNRGASVPRLVPQFRNLQASAPGKSSRAVQPTFQMVTVGSTIDARVAIRRIPKTLASRRCSSSQGDAFGQLFTFNSATADNSGSPA